ncbi:MAG: hypothetical protein GKR90_11120 [Pseudomonadales bacterium]|nr:hypothetical protein [Pseudomonadales bacterium]
MTYDHIPFLLFALLLGTASIFDVMFRIIPNWVCALVALLGISTHVTLSGADGFSEASLGLLLPLALLVPLYAAKVMGAGDVKLIAAVGAFVGFTQVLNCLGIIVILGGLVGILHIAMSRIHYYFPMATRFYFPGAQVARGYIPYGIAIAVGGIWHQYQMYFQVQL